MLSTVESFCLLLYTSHNVLVSFQKRQ